MHTQRPEFLVVVLTLFGRREDRGRKGRAFVPLSGKLCGRAARAQQRSRNFLKPVVQAEA